MLARHHRSLSRAFSKYPSHCFQSAAASGSIPVYLDLYINHQSKPNTSICLKLRTARLDIFFFFFFFLFNGFAWWHIDRHREATRFVIDITVFFTTTSYYSSNHCRKAIVVIMLLKDGCILSWLWFITSQHGSAWHYYICPLLSIGKMRFSTSRPGKNNQCFVTKLGWRDNVGKIYKLTKFGKDRLRNNASTWWWNITVLWLSSSTFFNLYFFPFPRPAHRSQFWSELHA